MKVTIERSKWLRGEGWQKSKLLRKADGKMCCLGFLSLQCGYTEDQIVDRGAPGALFVTGSPVPDNLFPEHIVNREYPSATNFVTSRLMRINDDESLTEEKREQALTELFRSAGIEVKFV